MFNLTFKNTSNAFSKSQAYHEVSYNDPIEEVLEQLLRCAQRWQQRYVKAGSCLTVSPLHVVGWFLHAASPSHLWC